MIDIKSEKRNTLTLVLFAVYLLALVWLILFKLQFSIAVMDEGRVVNLIPLLGSFDDNGVIRFSEIRNNILAFIPLGIYIWMLKAPWPFAKKVLATVVLTLAFEITQFIFAIGRADITDVLSNTLGGVIGIGIYALLFKLMKGKTNKVLNILAAVLTALVILFVVLLLVNHRWVRIK
ncbi:VanZ family protein [Desulfocucumis palustris]|uniref:VanZ family protein n=1 Tax=Desulfocucumis palustris TaxID=1898651 RepID=UPI001E3584DC|nr:VanZ family protein [Desulfocucumis palustris]